jgi:hypothetical protein
MVCRTEIKSIESTQEEADSRVVLYCFYGEQQGYRNIRIRGISNLCKSTWELGDFCNVLIALTFPIPLNALVVSQRVNTCRPKSAVHNSCLYCCANLVISINLFLFPVPVRHDSYDGTSVCRKEIKSIESTQEETDSRVVLYCFYGKQQGYRNIRIVHMFRCW